MKPKVIVGVIIAAALCSQVYALQITKGKLVSHREQITNGAKGLFATGTKTLQSLKPQGDQAASDVFPAGLIADMTSLTTTIGVPVDVKNQAMIAVTNTTNVSRDYNYNVVTCAKSDISDNTECVQYFNVITLEPNGSFWDAIAPTLTMTYQTAGVYNTYAGTYYSAVNNDSTVEPNPSEYGSSSATATITVS